MSDHPIPYAEPLSVARLRDCLERATPGPWRCGWDYKCVNPHEPDGWLVAHATGPQFPSCRPSDPARWKLAMDTIQADSALFSTAVNALPTLLARLDYLEDAYRWFSESGQARKDRVR